MNCDHVAESMQLAGFTLTAMHSSVVTGDRAVAGHVGLYRCLVVAGCDRQWSATLLLKRSTLKPGEFAYDEEPLFERKEIASQEHLELWLGGAVSQPLDEIEIRALAKIEPLKRIA